jgi:hypothetical protein
MPYASSERKLQYMRERNAKIKAEGRCVQCAKPSDGKQRCPVCREYWRQRNKARIDAGKCVTCGLPSKPGKRLCMFCAGQKYAHQKAVAKSGKCWGCWMPVGDGKSYCNECREKERLRIQALKREAFNAYGGSRCACCGEDQFVFLQLDHIEPGGASERNKSNLAGPKLYAKLRREGFPPGYQVLCANCNFAKGLLGQCPHQKER